MKIQSIYLVVTFGLMLTGCSVAKGTGRVVKGVTKVGWSTAKVTSKVAYKTTKAVGKSVRTVVYMAKGKQVIPLQREGNSLYVTAKLNGKANARFLVDTGASSMQISASVARKLKINLNRADATQVRIANGQVVSAREVIIKEIRIRGVKVKNVPALVLDYEMDSGKDGLLGMSFLNHFVFQIDADRPELILQQKAN